MCDREPSKSRNLAEGDQRSTRPVHPEECSARAKADLYAPFAGILAMITMHVHTFTPALPQLIHDVGSQEVLDAVTQLFAVVEIVRLRAAWGESATQVTRTHQAQAPHTPA